MTSLRFPELPLDDAHIFEHVSLKGYTSLNIGGVARYFSTAATHSELIALLFWRAQNNIPLFLLGAGTNILISDRGFDGLVIKLGGDFKRVTIDECKAEVTAGAAMSLPELSVHMMKNGYSGFQFMIGIPGTVGGAVVMNAGTQSREIKDIFTKAMSVDLQSTVREHIFEDTMFEHRQSSFTNTPLIIMEATFRISGRRPYAELREEATDLLANRRSRHPPEKMNCGSVFRRPQGGHPAGWYIERAGMKGYHVGGASVSEKHANWIVNDGTATSEDFKAVVRHVQNSVMEQCGISLEREVLYMPDDIEAVK